MSTRLSTTRRRRNKLAASFNNVEAVSQHTSALVLEIGTAQLVAGFAGESHPRQILPLDSSSNHTQSGYLYNDGFSLFNTKTRSKWEEELTITLSNLYMKLSLKPKSRRVVIITQPYTLTNFVEALYRVLFNTLSVPSVKVIEGGTIGFVPLALGKKCAIILDVGRFESRVACVCHYDSPSCIMSTNNCGLIEDTLNIVPCGFESFVRHVMTSYNQDNGLNDIGQVQELDDGISIIRASFEYLSSRKNCSSDDEEKSSEKIPTHLPCSVSGEKIHVPPSMVQNCLNENYFSTSNPNSLLHAFLKCLQSCPIDLTRKMVENVVFCGGGIDALNNSGVNYLGGLENKFMTSAKSLFQNNNNDNVEATTTRFQELGPVIASHLSVIDPLPFSHSSIAWVGASAMTMASEGDTGIGGVINSNYETWTHRREYLGSIKSVETRS